MSNQARIYLVVSRVFGVPVEKIDDESSPDTITGWDSVHHLNLLMALESEFGISLKPDDAMEMISVRLIRRILSEYGVESSDAG